MSGYNHTRPTLENENTVLLGKISMTQDSSIERYNFITGNNVFKIGNSTYNV